MDLEQILVRIHASLDTLYERDKFLIENDLCEPCINHRFAMYLQERFPEHFVDCEYNRSHIGDENSLKRVTREAGNFIDIIVGKRDRNPDSDFICFETKKWNNGDRRADRQKLQILTSGNQFGYNYGFFVIFGEQREDVRMEIFHQGIRIAGT